MKIFSSIVILVCILSGKIGAQNEQDLLRYSQNNLFGTARVQSLGGAFGSIGADFGGIAINPANIAFFRRNEITGSAAITAYKNDSRYIGNNSSDSRTNFNIPQLGIVFSKVNQDLGKDAKHEIVSFSFAAGVTRINDYQQNINFIGNNTKSSITDMFAQQLQGNNFNSIGNDFAINFPPAMAWKMYLIDTIGSNNTYASWFQKTNDSVFTINQKQLSENRGRLNEWNISAGLNVGNTLYLGGSAIFQNAYFESTSTFSENVLSKSQLLNQYQSMELKSNSITSGFGIGGRFGVIFRPIEFARIGLSYTTPIRLNLSDEYYYSMKSNFVSSNLSYSTTTFDYQILTPAKITASVSLISNRFGFISIDYDVVNYKTAEFKKTTELQLLNANDAAKKYYTTATNIRIGGEYRLKNMRFRGGYAMYGSPFNSNTSEIKETLASKNVTAGIGFIFPAVDKEGNDFFIDAAVVNSWGITYTTPYVVSGKTTYTSKNEFDFMNFMITAGYRF